MTKFLGLPVLANNLCLLFVVPGWLPRGMVSRFMKIRAKFETSVSRYADCICFYDGQRTRKAERRNDIGPFADGNKPENERSHTP